MTLWPRDCVDFKRKCAWVGRRSVLAPTPLDNWLSSFLCRWIFCLKWHFVVLKSCTISRDLTFWVKRSWPGSEVFWHVISLPLVFQNRCYWLIASDLPWCSTSDLVAKVLRWGNRLSSSGLLNFRLLRLRSVKSSRSAIDSAFALQFDIRIYYFTIISAHDFLRQKSKPTVLADSEKWFCVHFCR